MVIFTKEKKGPPRTRFTTKQRAEIFRRCVGRCKCCAKRLAKNNWHVAHIKARAKGGSDHTSNLTACCPQCNLKCGTQNQRDWAKKHYPDGPLAREKNCCIL